VSRREIFNLDMSGVQMVCISYLEISGTPAHLRYLLRRLKQKAKAPTLVGLWPAEDAVLKSETMRATLGANYYVSSLRDAVVKCLKVATGDEKLPEPANTPAIEEATAAKRLPLPA
jgi:hypothetical protein